MLVGEFLALQVSLPSLEPQLPSLQVPGMVGPIPSTWRATEGRVPRATAHPVPTPRGAARAEPGAARGRNYHTLPAARRILRRRRLCNPRILYGAQLPKPRIRNVVACWPGFRETLSAYTMSVATRLLRALSRGALGRDAKNVCGEQSCYSDRIIERRA